MQMSVRADALFYVSFYEPATQQRTVRRWDYGGDVTTPCSFTKGDLTTAAAFTTARVYLHANAKGDLYSCELIGTSGQFVKYGSNLYIDSLTATADRVFWSQDGSVTSGADGAMDTLLRGELMPADVGSKVTTVTFTGGELFVTTAGGELWSCAPENCKATLRKIAGAGILESVHLLVSHTVAADADAVYYIAVDALGAGTKSSRLMKVAR